MTNKELQWNIWMYSHLHPTNSNPKLPIAKNDLVVDKSYLGICRNANVAKWNGEQFEYQRTKFGSTFTEKINHFEDDNGYDVFVPFEIVETFKY